MNPRLVAVHCLQQVISQQKSLTETLLYVKNGHFHRNFTPQEIALIQELCFGCLRWHYQLGAILDTLLAKPLKKRDCDIEYLLHIGLYQIIYLRTPDHAAVNETVKGAKCLKKQWAKGLINGILRGFLRHRERIMQDIQAEAHTRYAFPHWLLDRIRTVWPEHWQSILEASNQKPPMALRVNLSRITRENYLEKLTEHGFPAELAQHSSTSIILSQAIHVGELPGFNEGLVSVQDTSAQLAAPLLDCQANMRVLDACAAPGGKTGHLLEQYPNIQVTAIDTREERLQRIEENLTRLDLSATLIKANAAAPEAWWDQHIFDRILLDAPCSATGVIRRHADIKVLRKAKDIKKLCKTQQELLDALWPLLATNGLMVYVTCSILPEENEEQMKHFLARHQDAQIIPLEVQWGIALQLGCQILPGNDNMDGFYYAVLRKQAQ